MNESASAVILSRASAFNALAKSMVRPLAAASLPPCKPDKKFCKSDKSTFWPVLEVVVAPDSSSWPFRRLDAVVVFFGAWGVYKSNECDSFKMFNTKYSVEMRKIINNLTLEAAVAVAGVVGEFELAPVEPDARLPWLPDRGVELSDERLQKKQQQNKLLARLF